MIALADRSDESWKPPIVLTVAQTGQGVDEVVEKVDEHRRWLESSGELARRRVRRARDEIEAIAVTALRRRWGNVHERTELDDLAEQVVEGKSDPYTAADTLLETYAE
jgi:LAO/AO transport system kinase